MVIPVVVNYHSKKAIANALNKKIFIIVKPVHHYSMPVLGNQKI
jgi:hypothetical protein